MVDWQRLKRPGLYGLVFVLGYALASGSCEGFKDIIDKELGAEGMQIIEGREPRPKSWMCHEKYDGGRWRLECYDIIREE